MGKIISGREWWKFIAISIGAIWLVLFLLDSFAGYSTSAPFTLIVIMIAVSSLVIWGIFKQETKSKNFWVLLILGIGGMIALAILVPGIIPDGFMGAFLEIKANPMSIIGMG